jgi:hypothetical protein
MIYLKRLVDFLAVPFILVGGIACLIYSAMIAGWVVIGNWYETVSRDNEEG